jgi:hypothetical protein
MNSQELSALQEAYSQVYELDEVSQKTATRAFAARATDEFESDGADYNYTKGGKSKADETKRRIEKKHGKAAGQHAERAAHAKIFGRKKTALTSMPPKPTKTNEAVDLYDIILSHLLDEGYADTEQAAEAIMVNMSEDWRESIMEANKYEGEIGATKKQKQNLRRDRDFGGVLHPDDYKSQGEPVRQSAHRARRGNKG